MKGTRSRRYFTLTALVALSLTAAACGSGDEPGPPKEPAVSQAEEDAVVRAARAYLQNRDPGRCGLVATPSGVSFCRRYAQTQTVTEPDLSIIDVAVARETATVKFVAAARDEGAILMRKFRDEWRGEAVQGRDYQPRE